MNQTNAIGRRPRGARTLTNTQNTQPFILEYIAFIIVMRYTIFVPYSRFPIPYSLSI
ncbi:MAG: hypothetical protein F6J98_40260 [Moorea sp. SIO4G2]|nr:hypothetical protein [Moorena sp. SIO4A3]NEO66287.1 hypothetical protein [Moorena sp. SIO4G2]